MPAALQGNVKIRGNRNRGLIRTYAGQMSSPLGQTSVELVTTTSVLWPGCNIQERKTSVRTDTLASPLQYNGVNKVEGTGAEKAD